MKILFILFIFILIIILVLLQKNFNQFKLYLLPFNISAKEKKDKNDKNNKKEIKEKKIVKHIPKDSTVDKCMKFIENKNKNYIKKKCTTTKDDKYDCQRIYFDEMIVDLNAYFNTLRCLEYSDPSINKINKNQYLKARKIFIYLYDKIFNNNDENSLAYLSEFSRELYQRSIYYYSYLNNKQKIKNIFIYNYIKNNDCLLPLLENGIKADLLHFDTHSDHNEFEHISEYDKLINEVPINISKIKPITYDIACFSSYYVYYSKKNFFWINPLWTVESPDYKKEIVKMEKNPHYDEIQFASGELNEKDTFVYVRGKIKDNYNELIKDLNNNFILSIDLDYFCTNGMLEKDIIENLSNKKEILKEEDAGSYGRTRLQTEFRTPYFYYDRENEAIEYNIKEGSYNEYIKNLKKEIKLIDKRINKFKDFLTYVKNNKKCIPSQIVISDSCNIHLSRHYESISITNDFCPQNLVLYIRHKLFIILQELYNSYVIDYLEWYK